MKYLIYLLTTIYLLADCSPLEIKKAKELYNKSMQESNMTQKIEILERAIGYCPFPEIEVTQFYFKAENSSETSEKLIFYRQALVAVSDFDDEVLLKEEQKRLNLIIGDLTKEKDKRLSDIFRKKVEYKEIDKRGERREAFTYGFMGFFFFLLLWVVFTLFKKS